MTWLKIDSKIVSTNKLFSEYFQYLVAGNVTSQIRATRSKCMGNVEVFYEGQYLPVCQEALTDQKTRDIICKEQSCGTAVNIIEFFGPEPQSSGIKQIQCAADKNLLRECDISPDLTSCTYAGLQCSGTLIFCCCCCFTFLNNHKTLPDLRQVF